MSEDRRRHPRVPVRLPVTVGHGDECHTYMTQDVSISGIFVQTDAPQPARKLITIRVRLLPSERSLEMKAVVAHSVRFEMARERGLTAGMGLELNSLRSDTRTLWEGYVGLLLRRSEEGEASTEAQDAGEKPLVETAIQMTVTNTAPLTQVFTKGVSLGGIFVFSEWQPRVGQEVDLYAHHDATGQDLDLRGEVFRSVPVGPGSGFGVRFDGRDKGSDTSEPTSLPMITLNDSDVTIEEMETLEVK